MDDINRQLAENHEDGNCPSGMVLPLFGRAELALPNILLIFLYGLGLFWSFLAVGIVADVFMSGIETITSQTKKIKGPNGKEYELKVSVRERRSDQLKLRVEVDGSAR
jgi:hypothetical protein